MQSHVHNIQALKAVCSQASQKHPIPLPSSQLQVLSCWFALGCQAGAFSPEETSVLGFQHMLAPGQMESAWGPIQRLPNPSCLVSFSLPAQESLTQSCQISQTCWAVSPHSSQMCLFSPKCSGLSSSLSQISAGPAKPRPALMCSPCLPCWHKFPCQPMQNKLSWLTHSTPDSQLCCSVCSLHPPSQQCPS